jgi:hypothetical protein
LELFYLDKKRKIFWIFDPIFYPLLKYFKGITLYDCVDLVANKNQRVYRLLKKHEKKLIKSVNYFFVNSQSLKEKHCKVKEPVKVLPQGFCIDVYQNPLSVKKRLGVKKPIIGFLGAINQRINFNLVYNLVKRNPDWNFVFWGSIQDNDIYDLNKTSEWIDKLLKLYNFIFGKSKNRNEVPDIVKQFDVGIIPYDSSQEINYYCYPMKLFEYFYENKPVVSSDIKEVKRFTKLVSVAKDTKEWEKKIKYCLSNPLSPKIKKDQKRLAENNSWENKIYQILKTISF